MKSRNRLFKRIAATSLVAVLILQLSAPTLAAVKRERYVVTSNWYYDNDYNIIGRYSSRESAINAIKRQPEATRGQWYVYDTSKGAVVYPLKVKTRRGQIEKAVDWARAIARDSRHGYSCAGELSGENLHLVSGRWGRHGDYSCSTLVVMAYELTGFAKIRLAATRNISTFVQLKGKHRGGEKFRGISSVNLGEILLATTRFKEITAPFRRNGMSYLEAGDVLIPVSRSHVMMYIGSGKFVEGRTNEKGIEYLENPKPGDQSGSEITITNYRSDFYRVYRPIVGSSTLK